MYYRVTLIFFLTLVAVIAITVVVFFIHPWFNIEERQIRTWISLSIELATLVTLIITAIFVIFYWNETKEMKEEMVRQNNINEKALDEIIRHNNIGVQSNKVAMMPVMNLKLSKRNGSQSNYDIILTNTGKGLANVSLCHIDTDPEQISRQYLSMKNLNVERQTKPVPVGPLASGESKVIYSFHDKSICPLLRITIGLFDLFGEKNEWVFIGDTRGFRLKKFPRLINLDVAKNQT